MIDVKGKRVYLSGPMSDFEHYNCEAFARAHAELKERGAREVYNPAIVWLTGVAERSRENAPEDWRRISIQELTRPLRRGCLFDPPRYDLVIQLHGWGESEGARLEAEVAGLCGIPCHGIEEAVA